MNAAVTLSSSAATRIGQLVRMLGSDHPGEVFAAVTALQRTLRSAGTDLHYLADVTERALLEPPPLAAPPPPPPPPRPRPHAQAPRDNAAGNIADAISFCVFWKQDLNDKERGFIFSLYRSQRVQGRAFDPSEKQRSWLVKIEQQLRIEGRE
jgi:hypothetical protein